MIMCRILILTMLAVSLFNCSEYPQETEILKVNQAAIESQQPAQHTDVSIGPAHATAGTIITLKAPDSLMNGGEIKWYINGDNDASSKGVRFVPNDLKKEDILQAVISKDGKEYYSNELTIKNTPPVIRKATLLPVMPLVSSRLTVDMKATDIDNDVITYKYRWTLNNTFAGEESYLDTDLKRGDAIAVTITPVDGDDEGRSTTLQSRVFNSPPVVSESTASYDGKHYTYQIAATDPDNDALTFSLQEGPEGMTIDPARGIMTWELAPDHKGLFEAKVLVTDNKGSTILVPVTTVVGNQEKAE